VIDPLAVQGAARHRTGIREGEVSEAGVDLVGGGGQMRGVDRREKWVQIAFSILIVSEGC
jgi:hypothetical protein